MSAAVRIDSPILLLDGGLGTSLEDKYGATFVSATTPLWSSHLLLSAPETLLACQRDFGHVPVDIIETATYQVSAEGFARTRTEQWPAGIGCENIPHFLEKAVEIACRARGGPDARLALSLGPYGATMTPGREYDGRYDAEHNTEEKLYDWWVKRLDLFEKAQIADKVQFIACETMPRIDEIAAVRRIFKDQQQDPTSTEWETIRKKRFWISCVFPGDDDKLPDGSSVDQVVSAMLAQDDSKGEPWGVGINCTKVWKLDRLVGKYEDAISRGIKTNSIKGWPALVLYPDGTNGEVYNTSTQKWELPAGQDKPRKSWEQQLGRLVLDTSRRRRWKTIVVGGCCKASHNDIKKLMDFVRTEQAHEHEL